MSEHLISLETLLLMQPQDENINWTYRGLHFDIPLEVGLQGHLALSMLFLKHLRQLAKGSLLIKGNSLFQDQIYLNLVEVTQEQVEQKRTMTK